MPAKPATLYAALLTCEDQAEVKQFLADLLSPGELAHARRRWAIAQTYMQAPCSQRHAKELHGGSWDVVRRVFDAVQNGSGYRRAYFRLFPNGPVNENIKKPL
jgi:uncharacterized protein YerC